MEKKIGNYTLRKKENLKPFIKLYTKIKEHKFYQN